MKNFSEIQTRPTVHESVPYICNKIIAHFTKEISLTDRLFEVGKCSFIDQLVKKSLQSFLSID